MVYAAVQECSVVGHQDEPLFRAQIPAHQLPPPDVQVVRGFINQQKVVLLGKQHRKLELCLLPIAQGVIGAVEYPVIQMQIRHFPLNFPIFIVRVHGFHRVNGKNAFVLHGIREVGKGNRGGNAALIVIFSQKQIQKGSFAPAIPADKAQTPARVNLKADILKNVFVTALIGKG